MLLGVSTGKFLAGGRLGRRQQPVNRRLRRPVGHPGHDQNSKSDPGKAFKDFRFNNKLHRITT